jgi:hypothetical protein
MSNRNMLHHFLLQIDNYLPDDALDFILQHVAALQPPDSRRGTCPDFALWRTLASVDFRCVASHLHALHQSQQLWMIAWPAY